MYRRISTRLTPAVRSFAHIAQQGKKNGYVSPYDLTQPPLDYIILHNRSKHAVNFAIRKLKDAWPTLQIIQAVQQGRERVLGADWVVPIQNWTSMAHFHEQLLLLAARNPLLRASLAARNVGFYSIWSSQAENAAWAKEAHARYQWIGGSPEKMSGLDKREFKKLCHTLELPTARFIEVDPSAHETDKEIILRKMAEELVEAYTSQPYWTDQPIFVKHNEGGGGRGTKKVLNVTVESVLDAIRKVVNETGGNLHGVYAEEALDLADTQLFQMEIEGDAGQLAEGARLVGFNRENQKVYEIGFTDQAITEVIPATIYAACRHAAQAICHASGFDNRGTVEILLAKTNENTWRYSLLEFNKRVQVENEALAELVVNKDGRTRNVPAEQVMRSLGYPPPGSSDFCERGPALLGHLRVLSCQITPTGSRYPSGLRIDGAIYPQGEDVQFVRGDVYLDADPQIGRALIPAQSWLELCDKMARFAQEFCFYGPKTTESTYFDFVRKLAMNPAFRAQKLGCNQTFDVLADAPQPRGQSQKIVHALQGTVTPLVLHGYRTNDAVKHQPYPTEDQLHEFVQFMDNIAMMTPPETPFSRFLQHQHFATYIDELKALLAKRGGGSVTVAPRDVQQASCDQESALIQAASAKIAQIYFAGSIGVGYETGGAQYQAALMRKFDWLAVLLEGCLTNLPSHSLTRSKWLNGLTIKTEAEQAFVMTTIAEEVTRHYGVSSSSMVPWMPYNFHAGNHPEQDTTTRIMLRANLMPIPTWAWDPRYTVEHFSGWVKRQLRLFAEENQPLVKIRIKNPGQGIQWIPPVIVNHVEIILKLFREHNCPDPIIYIHNHDFNGLAAHASASALEHCRRELGYHFLVVDSAPPGTPFNSNLIIARRLNLTHEEREYLDEYNRGMHLALNLTKRFNNQEITRAVQDPYSEMAGGTNSSDLADARKLTIPLHRVSKAIALAKEVIGLGTPVTPFSEWIKQIGFAIEKNDAILPKTAQAVHAYIEQGGQLAIATPILHGLNEWATLLPQPQLVRQLLANHGITAKPTLTQSPQGLDIVAKQAELQAKLPTTRVTPCEVATWLGFDNIGLQALIEREIMDLSSLMHSPAFVYSHDKKVGDAFYLFGEKLTISRIYANENTGKVEVDYTYQGHTICTSGENPRAHMHVMAQQIRRVKDSQHECGAPMPGKLTRFFVQPGDTVKRGDIVATVEAMKMEHAIKAPRDAIVHETCGTVNDSVEENEVVVAFRVG